MQEHWRVEPGRRVHLREFDPTDTRHVESREAAETAVAATHERVFALQDRLWAENRRSLLVVLQGIDAAGKDGTIAHVFRGVNPQATRVSAFKQPTAPELAHDFLWRVHAEVPRRGEIGIFNRSHYEDVLVVRVHDLIDDGVWHERFENINAFERLLSSNGTSIVKLLLHISKDEQGRRLDERIKDPNKQWKITESDLEEHHRYAAYEEVFSETLSRTSTELAPWFIVPADHKWYRNWVVSTILLETLEAMDPHYPKASATEKFDGVSRT